MDLRELCRSAGSESLVVAQIRFLSRAWCGEIISFAIAPREYISLSLRFRVMRTTFCSNTKLPQSIYHHIHSFHTNSQDEGKILSISTSIHLLYFSLGPNYHQTELQERAGIFCTKLKQ